MDEPPQDTILLTALSTDERTRALQRYQILQPFLEHGLSLSQLAHHHDIPRRTLYDWLAQYQRHGLAGLTRRSRRDRGHHRGLRPELKELIEGLALRKTATHGGPSPPTSEGGGTAKRMACAQLSTRVSDRQATGPCPGHAGSLWQ